jgi:hypothetical protein
VNTSPSPIANTLLGVFLVVTLTSGCQPAALPEETVPPGAAAEENLGDLGEMEALGDIEVDRGLFFVDVVLPAEFSEGITQESLDSDLAENGFRSATLNEAAPSPTQ